MIMFYTGKQIQLCQNCLFSKVFSHGFISTNVCLNVGLTMVNGLHLYSAFIQSALQYWHSPIHTPTVDSTVQGDSQLVRSSQGEASPSGTPPPEFLPPTHLEHHLLTPRSSSTPSSGSLIFSCAHGSVGSLSLCIEMCSGQENPTPPPRNPPDPGDFSIKWIKWVSREQLFPSFKFLFFQWPSSHHSV